MPGNHSSETLLYFGDVWFLFTLSSIAYGITFTTSAKQNPLLQNHVFRSLIQKFIHCKLTYNNVLNHVLGHIWNRICFLLTLLHSLRVHCKLCTFRPPFLPSPRKPTFGRSSHWLRIDRYSRLLPKCGRTSVRNFDRFHVNNFRHNIFHFLWNRENSRVLQVILSSK